MTDAEKYLKKLCDYILDSLNNLGVYPENITTSNRAGARYLVLDIMFDSQCLGEPLKKGDGSIFYNFLRETVLKFLDSNTPDMLPTGIRRCEIYLVTAQPWNNGASDINWEGASGIGFFIFLRYIKK